MITLPAAWQLSTCRTASAVSRSEYLLLITGFTAPVEYLPKRAGDVRDAQIDPRLAERELGWTPGTSLHEGLSATLNFFRDRLPA